MKKEEDFLFESTQELTPTKRSMLDKARNEACRLSQEIKLKLKLLEKEGVVEDFELDSLD